jgi:signal transduction histidine kinase
MSRKQGDRDAEPESSRTESGPILRELAALVRENALLLAQRQSAELVRDEYVDLYELAPLPALTLDVGYVIRRLNGAMAELLATDANECLKHGLRRFVLSEDRKSLSTHLAKAGRGSLERCRLHLLPSGGAPIPVELWTKVLARTGLYQIHVVDLSGQEKLDLESERLMESERAARSENAAKDTFIAMLSHELRTPLTPALAAASYFCTRAQGPEAKAFATIQRSILAEVRMVDDLLDVNRVLRGKMNVTCRTESVHDIAREAAESQRADADAKRQRLELELDAERCYANVDAVRLRQVFFNLIRNAIKFTGNGGTIRVRSWNQASTIMVEVEDTGIGIPPADLDRLFRPFDQLDRRPGVSGGLGLGLTISRGLVELQGGKLVAHSNGRGQGSRFVVELGAVDAAGAAKPAASGSDFGPVPEPAGEPLRVLLVEDDPDTAEIMAELLEAEGFLVQTALSAEAAKRVDLAVIDLIVSDLGLPDQSGLELIRELQAKRHRPALALSGFGMDVDVLAARAAGFDEHLTKPVDAAKLLSILRRLAAGPV